MNQCLQQSVQRVRWVMFTNGIVNGRKTMGSYGSRSIALYVRANSRPLLAVVFRKDHVVGGPKNRDAGVAWNHCW